MDPIVIGPFCVILVGATLGLGGSAALEIADWLAQRKRLRGK
jgi:hypothetical protein